MQSDRSLDEALGRVEAVIRSMPRGQIVTKSHGYLRAEFRSLIFGFVDDVEFSTDELQGVLHIRSGSRVAILTWT